MTLDEIKLRRLAGHHLLSSADTQTVVKDLCGLQSQFLSHAVHGLSIRTNDTTLENLVKSWTNRGTMHLFSVDDLPLFLHEGRTHFLRPVDTMESDAYIDKARKAYFAELILDGIFRGMEEREALKVLCENAGMTEGESKSLFDPWGGLIRALCETGHICQKVQEKKAYQLCPDFEPMAEDAAWKELGRRYFMHFGPATVKDAAYFFGITQAKVRRWLKDLPVLEIVLKGKSFFYIDNGPVEGEIPSCLFLAGFDQLMLGYEKSESIFLPVEHRCDIVTLGGIVRPAILTDGNVTGWWNLKNRKLSVTMFGEYNAEMITETAKSIFADIKKIEFQ